MHFFFFLPLNYAPLHTVSHTYDSIQIKPSIIPTCSSSTSIFPSVMSGRAMSSLLGSTTPIVGPLDETAQERQRHLRQNQEIIRLCSLKSIQARQLQEKMSQLERDNLDLHLALSRKDREARISKSQSPSQCHCRPNRYNEVRTERFKYPGHSYQSPLSGESRASQDLLHLRFSGLSTSYQHSLHESRSVSKSEKYFSAGQESPGPASLTLDRVLGAMEVVFRQPGYR